MQLTNTLKFTILLVFILTADAFAGGSISGKLLKVGDKPLAYTEIELVPVDADAIPNDSRFWAISGGGGTFAFNNVPPGKYTLSINFGEEPTELSPYQTFYYPNATRRSEAQIFEIAETSRIAKLIFRLPPPLVTRKINGKVVDSKNQPFPDVYVSLTDIASDDSSFSFTIKTDKNGAFSLKGFDGRIYQIRAILLAKPLNYPEQPDVLAAKQSDHFVLSEETSKPVLTIKDTDYRQKPLGIDGGILGLKIKNHAPHGITIDAALEKFR